LPALTSHQFEDLARSVFSEHFYVPLQPGKISGVPKLFDLVSPEGDIAGDVKYFTMARGQRLPLAKFSVIAEDVWLLEKTSALIKFLVFGNDIEVPKRWLARYGNLNKIVDFYYLTNSGELNELIINSH